MTFDNRSEFQWNAPRSLGRFFCLGLYLPVLFLFLFETTNAKTEVIPRSYYRSEDVHNFSESGSFESFLAIPDELKFYAILDLYYDRERAKWPPARPEQNASPDTDRILAHFLPFLSLDDRTRIDELAYKMALADASPETLNYFFEVGTKSSLALKKKFICSVLEDAGRLDFRSFDSELFSKESRTIGDLLPIIVKNNFNDLVCKFDVGEIEKTSKANYSLLDLINMLEPAGQTAVRKILVELNAKKLLPIGSRGSSESKSNQYVNPTIACTPKELLSYLKEAFVILAPHPVPTAHLLIINQPKCSLNLMLTKRKKDYQLQLNFATPYATSADDRRILVEKTPEGFVELILNRK